MRALAPSPLRARDFCASCGAWRRCRSSNPPVSGFGRGGTETRRVYTAHPPRSGGAAATSAPGSRYRAKRAAASLLARVSDVEARRTISALRRHWTEHGFGEWAVERATRELIGKIGLVHHADWQLGATKVEIGWTLARHAWGQGLATEAAQLALDDAFERVELDRVISIARHDNVRSRRVMEKLGMRRQGRTRWRGSDMVWYAIERERVARAQRRAPPRRRHGDEPPARGTAAVREPVDRRGGDRRGRRDAALGLADHRAPGGALRAAASPSYVGTRHAVAVASCTGALHISLVALRRSSPGDEVITTPDHVLRHRPRDRSRRGAARCSWTSSPDTGHHRPRRDRGGRRPAHGRDPARAPGGPALRHGPDRRRSRAATAWLVIEDAAHAVGAAWRGRSAGSLGQRGLLQLLRHEDDHHRRGRHGHDRRLRSWRRGSGSTPTTACTERTWNRDDGGHYRHQQARRGRASSAT